MLIPWSMVGTAVLGAAGSVWYARDYIDTQLASKTEVIIAGAKADYTLDKQMEGIISQINNLERKPNKTRDDLNQLNYLREQLKIMQQIRRGK